MFNPLMLIQKSRNKMQKFVFSRSHFASKCRGVGMTCTVRLRKFEDTHLIYYTICGINNSQLVITEEFLINRDLNLLDLNLFLIAA